ncbi:hypothetical protein U0070_000588 [Myodes glareolus]|uniref:Uncharacterized protein n=1 Tax=Myodes glareolus TaxID=447135 RepID=A0AAW0IIN0_MYOGA
MGWKEIKKNKNQKHFPALL